MEKLGKPKYDFSSLLTTPASGKESDGSYISLPNGNTSAVSYAVSSVRWSFSSLAKRRFTATPHSSIHRQNSSISATPSTPSLQSAVIVAIVEGRGHARGEIGMASIDLKNPELILSQFPDRQTYVKVLTKLEVLNPIEIIMPNTACEATVQRKYFNEGKGLQMVRQFVVSDYNSVELEIVTKYYCLAAAAALLKYVEFIQNTVFVSNSLKVIFRGSEQTTMIDVATVKNLELISNMHDPKSSHSLFGILNYTKTQQGARLLRSNILQPPCSLETIKLRQKCVQEFIDNEDIFFAVESVLKRFLDVDHLISLLVQIPKNETVKSAENKINLVIYVKHCLELVISLQDAISTSQNPLLKTFNEILSDKRFPDLLQEIQKIVHDDTHYQKGSLNMRAQKCFAVKANLNGYLDVARKTYSETIDDIDELMTQLRENETLMLKTAYNNTRGFFIQITGFTNGQDLDIESLPPVFIKAVKTKTSINCTTADLIKMNDRCSESLNEIYIMTNVVIGGLLDVLRKNIGCLYKLSECVAMLDLLLSLAHTCTVSKYTIPEFTDTLAIRQGFHPILQKIAFEDLVPNNAYASDETNFVIVTGPNMSGKSTYMKQVALLQIMAQIGCFVPAEYASFRLTHQVFSRIGSDNDIETNASTFTVEMREINYILQNISDDSLVVIDELGRGTSSEEGVGLCYAICEKLLMTKAFTFFATHFLELTHLETLYPNVENYHFEMKCISSSDEVFSAAFTHHLVRGEAESTHYGLSLASLSMLPQSILNDAGEIIKEIQLQKASNQPQSKDSLVLLKACRLGTRLVQTVRSSKLDQTSLRVFLQHLKEQFQ
ncbi:PREDICTED: mutS protein homolog 4 isoform X2 [Amphimedon queenslandica]|uniref:DNA mismatch repair proteins mutS family domain-containing protein n=1 Tax=Amphimedon queenslandica TaxID=400682 RepID=A0AAN0IW31_AMPQE|nr:PREDICTED: mutS protein homolog 4 isoform X2 [Amphimedon queenslandica]|eukprot:XP_019848959.1 PREDICTED: mutS protein homolog 4 isoform X2 [Amphimedon queenslandica]